MVDLLLLSEAQMRRIEPCFALSHRGPRVNNRLLLSGILCLMLVVLRGRDARAAYGPHKTIYNPVLDLPEGASSAEAGWVCSTESSPHWRQVATRHRLMSDATNIKAQRTPASLLRLGLYLVASAAVVAA